MSSVKKEITFNKSMTLNKRNESFAYLRKNVLNEATPGLYPSRDYVQEQPTTDPTVSMQLLDVIGSDRLQSPGTPFKIKVIYKNSNDIVFYDLGTNTQSNSGLVSKTALATAFGSDGVYVVTTGSQVYRVNHTNSSTPVVGTLDGSPIGINVGGFDGLRYWWAGANGIWRQLPGTNATVIFPNLGIEPEKMDFYKDFMVLFAQRGQNVGVFLWDKSNTVAFTKRLIIKNANFLAGGVVDGVLMCVYSIGDNTNTKEYQGKIVVAIFDGDNFKEVNSIKTGKDTVKLINSGLSGSTMDTGSQVLLFCVADNDDSSKNPDLYQNYVYKVRNNGSIEVEMLPIANGARNYASIARVFYAYNVVAVGGVTGLSKALIYTNKDTGTSFNDYRNFNDTEYITEFLNEVYNTHRLDGLSLSFEKLYENTDAPSDPVPTLEVYFRTSERESFTLLGTVTPALVIANVDTRMTNATASTAPLPMQTYQFTKRYDNSTLPEYNEIQFKFKSKNGFTVVGAWYEYSYITRNILQ